MTTIYQRSEFHLTRLLVEISSLVSRKRPDPDTLQRFAHLITSHFGSSRAEIRVPILGGRGIAGPAEDGRAPFVVFSRRIAVRGVSYGEFSVYIPSPAYSPASTILTLETAAQLIGSLAERVRLLERREELAAELEATRETVVRSKLLSRAAGIVAALKSITAAEAERWLAAEAARAQRPVEELADRIIITRSIAAGRASRVPGLPLPLLRKTA
jgi:hypothetical protein